MKKLAALCVGIALAFLPTAAQAHSIWLYQGQDALILTDHHNGGIDDRECDGNVAYVDILFTNFETRRVYSEGCHAASNYFHTDRTMFKVWLCEQVDGAPDRCNSKEA